MLITIKWLRIKLRLCKRNFLRLLSANKIKMVMLFLFLVVSIAIGFYVYNFNHSIISSKGWLSVFDNLSFDNLSKNPANWGVFGDYVGGILNPSIALIALYLLVETYKLQKRELEATRSLLEVSTNAQKNQIKLAALTALLNSYVMKIDMLNSENISLYESVDKNNLNTSGNEE